MAKNKGGFPYRAYVTRILLVIFFPAGLAVMWSRRCRWPRFVKSLVSLAVAAAIAFILLPQTAPPSLPAGGVKLVDSASNDEVYGPDAPEDRLQVDVYTPHQTTVVIQVSPTPVPAQVYCNAGGKYYHSSDCKYVKTTSGAVTVTQALDAGYSKCPDCNAPDPYGY